MTDERQTPRDEATFTVKAGHAEMLKGGVIMDVVTPEQAKIAENAGAVAVMALERVPADIRAAGGVARMADPSIVQRIMESVTIPVMAKCRIGHFVEAQVLQSLGVDYIDESEVLTPADERHHINKHAFTGPFVCGARGGRRGVPGTGRGMALSPRRPDERRSPRGWETGRIGVLALEGAFREHAFALRDLGADPVEVRRPEDLDGLDGLIIPGGESTTIRMLMRELGLEEA